MTSTLQSSFEPWRRKLSLSTLAAMLFCVGLLAAFAGPSSAQESAETKPEAKQHGRQLAITNNIWWNRDKIVAAISLKEGTRQSLDEMLAKHLAERRVDLKSVRMARKEFNKALKSGDLDDARGKGDQLASLNSKMAVEKNEFTLSVLESLSAAQRKTLAEKHPEVFDRPWFRGGGRARGNGPSARRESGAAARGNGGS